MRSRAARVAISVMAVLAAGGATYVVSLTEAQIVERRAAYFSLDDRLRDVTEALTAARTGQQGYVATGQGVATWLPKVTTLLTSALGMVNDIQQTAVGVETRSSLTEASA